MKSKKNQAISVSALEYESLFDEALDIAHDLQEIEKEVRDCAFCGGKKNVTIQLKYYYRN